MSDSERPEERRAEARHFACFPAHVQRPGGSTRMALIHDLSVTGALLLTRERLQEGEPIRLSLYLADDTELALHASACVLRVTPRPAGRDEVWHHSVAVIFDAPLHQHEAEIKALAERQAALGLPQD
jgi:hypothetical protein